MILRKTHTFLGYKKAQLFAGLFLSQKCDIGGLFFRFLRFLFRFVDDLEGREREVGVFGEDGAFVGRLGQVAEALGIFDFR